MAFRFPAMKDAPLIETRVCQYEQTPDSHFIVDRHPRMNNVWLVGGGSGHGFKHGPALGEMMAESIVKRCAVAMPLADSRGSRTPTRKRQRAKHVFDFVPGRRQTQNAFPVIPQCTCV